MGKLYGVIWGLLIALLYPTTTFSASSKIVAEIYKKELLTREYDVALNEFFKRAAQPEYLNKSFGVNQQYDASKVNVYVLESDNRQRNIKIKTLGLSLDNALGNMLAVSPDIILVGENLLAEVLLHITNDIGYKSQIRGGDNAPPLSEQLAALIAMANFLRFGNINNTNTYQDLENHPSKYIPVFIANAVKLNGVSAFSSDIIFPGLLFYFAHEIAHLDKSTNGQVYDIWQAMKNERNKQVNKQEIQADKTALTVIKRASNNANAMFSVISVLELLRDRMLQDIFDGIRPIEVNELFFTLQHKPCKTNVDNTLVRTDNINTIAGGYWNILPILTAKEMTQLRNRFDKTYVNATHEHNFARANNLLKVLDNQIVPHLDQFHPIAPFSRFYNGVIHQQPYILPNQIEGETSILAKDFISNVGIAEKMIASPACPKELNCYTGKYHEKGFFDLIVKGKKVAYATVSFPIKREDIGKLKPGSEKGDEYLQELIMLLWLHGYMRGVTHDKTRMEFAGKEVSKIRTTIFECGIYSETFDMLGYELEITTARAGEWLRYKVYPKNHAIGLLR